MKRSLLLALFLSLLPVQGRAETTTFTAPYAGATSSQGSSGTQRFSDGTASALASAATGEVTVSAAAASSSPVELGAVAGRARGDALAHVHIGTVLVRSDRIRLTAVLSGPARAHRNATATFETSARIQASFDGSDPQDVSVGDGTGVLASERADSEGSFLNQVRTVAPEGACPPEPVAVDVGISVSAQAVATGIANADANARITIDSVSVEEIPCGPLDDRTGITPTTITLGLHAPLTGAAPMAPRAVAEGKDLYWRYLKDVKHEKIFGRDVNVVFANDEYSPTTAVAVCNTMAASDRAFLLIGIAGTEQINACAEYADPRGIPYLSPGMQGSGLSQRRTYSALTMTYPAQMPLLVQMLQRENGADVFDRYGGVDGGDGRITLGFVRPNTLTFDDAAAALRQATEAAGWTYKGFPVVKEGSSGEAKTTVTSAQQGGVDIFVPITAPTFTAQLALNSDTNAYKPQWAGVGVTNNLNQFLDAVCQRTGTISTVEGALWLSPWPGWKNVMASEYDADFKAAAQRYAPEVNTRSGGGDIMLEMWGISRAIHQALLAAGEDITRSSFIEAMSTFSLSNGFFPDLQYTPGDPFGARGVHLLKASCAEPGDGEFVSPGAQYIEHPQYPGLRNSF